ncbi:MAG: YraN family protein [Muribaculaceae bacterium]|nr:YraN family protein [Muribaculaceae bacterium]
MARHNDTGRFGEDAAAEYLAGQGYAIVDRNWRCGRMEIDIVAQRGSRLAIVEVKTRTDTGDDPIEAVDRKKQLAMVRAGVAYLNARRLPHELQFDIIAVSGTPDNYKLEHLEDAFYPPLKTY